jgi:hypothetical protein
MTFLLSLPGLLCHLLPQQHCIDDSTYVYVVVYLLRFHPIAKLD